MSMHEEYCDYGALPHSGPCLQGVVYADELLDRHVRQAVCSLEKRVKKLEQVSHTHVAPMMPSS